MSCHLGILWVHSVIGDAAAGGCPFLSVKGIDQGVIPQQTLTLKAFPHLRSLG